MVTEGHAANPMSVKDLVAEQCSTKWFVLLIPADQDATIQSHDDAIHAKALPPGPQGEEQGGPTKTRSGGSILPTTCSPQPSGLVPASPLAGGQGGGGTGRRPETSLGGWPAAV